MENPDNRSIRQHMLDFQNRLCRELETLDGESRFGETAWQRPEGGEGLTRVLAEGGVIEKAGVNFSHVFGTRLPPAATVRRPELADCPFEALGVSLIVHPRNPRAPASHLNIRFFAARRGRGLNPVWWFGGGFDLTPIYGYEEDAVHWHRTARKLCEPFGPAVYPRFKMECDRYFFLRHRGEARGIGGLFFDDLNEWGFDRCFAFLRAVGEGYLDGILPILRRRRHLPYGEAERRFQSHRRGRYVEFNLVQDRGTLFGLQSGGRAESILVSLPPLARWDHDWKPPPGSEEARLTEYFLVPRDWADHQPAETSALPPP